MTAQLPGTLTFQAGPISPLGHSRVDVMWSGFSIPSSPANNYWLNFGVSISATSGHCVDVATTVASKNPAITTGTVSASNGDVTIQATNIGSLGLASPVKLFSIYYFGSPGSTVTFAWRTSPPNQVININSPGSAWVPSLEGHIQEFYQFLKTTEKQHA